MATKTQVRRALAKVGATWDERHDCIDAPQGKVWQASECHSIAVVWDDPDARASEVYDELLRQIRLGVKDCTEPDCEFCED